MKIASVRECAEQKTSVTKEIDGLRDGKVLIHWTSLTDVFEDVGVHQDMALGPGKEVYAWLTVTVEDVLDRDGYYLCRVNNLEVPIDNIMQNPALGIADIVGVPPLSPSRYIPRASSKLPTPFWKKFFFKK